MSATVPGRWRLQSWEMLPGELPGEFKSPLRSVDRVKLQWWRIVPLPKDQYAHQEMTETLHLRPTQLGSILPVALDWSSPDLPDWPTLLGGGG